MGLMLIVLVLFTVLGFVGWSSERHSWNGGLCPRCWTRWIYFDTDSQGGRGYHCETRKHYVWISYPSIDREER